MMDKIVMRSINNSLKLHNWTKLSNYVAKFCTVQSSENFVQAYKKLENQKDILTGYTENITESIQKNDENIQNTELFKCMDEFRLSADEKINYDHIKNSTKFLQICTMIQKNAKRLNAYDIIKVLRFLFSLNTPSDTVLIATLLQLLKCYINYLTTSQIIQSYYMLQTQNETELIKALLKALKVVFNNQIQVELDTTNISTAICALKFAHKIKDENSITHIINVLCRTKGNINMYDAISIFYALSCMPKLHRSHERLLTKVKNVIIYNHKSLEYSTIQFLLHRIIHILETNLVNDFYFERLINVLCEAVMNKNEMFHKDIEILTLLNTMQYSDRFFIDYITKKCIEDPKTLTDCQPNEMLNFVESMNISSYKTKYWDTIEPLILEYTMNRSSTFSYTVAITYHLLSLDFYNKELLDHVFSVYNSRYHNIIDRNIMFYILKIHQYVKTLHPEYQGIALGQDTIDYIRKHIETENISPLKRYLKEVIRGNKYIRHNMKTKLGHTIDHVIILQPDGSPLAANDYSNSTYVEDIAVPIEYRRILILSMPVSLSCRYTMNEQSTWQKTVASLKTLTGCSVVSINLRKWITLHRIERKLYLQELLTI
ncbi:uncharacterized protein LOC143362927 isoform X2 [Halictus rubicundus]|uniref:uncharacterized protein LOC143362927 isoform X2 n=1 Tax=Halictus rubicundus TaxID=77578 RepID=UPI0040375295